MSVFTSGNASYIYIDDNAGNAANYWSPRGHHLLIGP